jgi:hypothetical protein
MDCLEEEEEEEELSSLNDRSGKNHRLNCFEAQVKNLEWSFQIELDKNAF